MSAGPQWLWLCGQQQLELMYTYMHASCRMWAELYLATIVLMSARPQ